MRGGDEPWEMAIFNLYNRILESGKARLLITGDRRRVSSIWGWIWRLIWTGTNLQAATAVG